MADIPVTRKSSNKWLWLLALLVLAALIWFLFGASGDGHDRTASAPPTTDTAAPTAPAQATAPTAAAIQTPPATPQAGDAPGSMGAPATAGSEAIKDPGAYASTEDKLSLVGRRAEFTDARVARVVGPKTFTVLTGGEELYVRVADDVDMGVGTQGQIDKGSLLNVEGSFRRLTTEVISDLSENRFRDLTDQERETLQDRQVYLNATGISKTS